MAALQDEVGAGGAPARPTIPVNGAVASGTSVGSIVTAAPTMVEKTATIVSCKTAGQRWHRALGSIDYEDVIGDVAGAVQSISFFIGRLAVSITLFLTSVSRAI